APPPTPQRSSDLASASPPNPQKKTYEAASIDQQLAQSLNVLQPSVEPPQRTKVLKDQPSMSGISVPNVAISPVPQDKPTFEPSAEPERSSTMPSPLANQLAIPRWEPSQRVSSPSPSPATNALGSSNPNPNRLSEPLDRALLSEQRFQPESTNIERRPIGELRRNPSGTSNVPIDQLPNGSIEPSESTLAPFDLSSSMKIEKSPKPVPARPSMGDLGGKPIELGSKTRIEPSAGIPPRQKSEQPPEISLPDLRPADVSPNRFRKTEPSGPRIASSNVPIPSPAFSQRIRRMTEREAEASSALGPLGPQTELSIERGLQFLTEHQRRDGSWSLGDYDSRLAMQSDTAATALALLCFQGAGYTHRQFKYEAACKAALDWLISHQRENGDLYQRSTPSSDANAWLYSHSIAALALCEAYGMTQDESIKGPAQRAVNFLVASQDPIGGGWRYSPRLGSDTSVTGWVMMAFKSAELAGLEVPSTAYIGINRWIENSKSREAPYLYRYNWQANSPTNQHGRVPTPSMTSVGLLIRLYLGWRRDNENMQKGTQWLLGRLPGEGTLQAPMRDTYYWYYATQVMFHVGGEKWKKWYGTLYPLLIRTQVADGEYAGSWDPMKPIPDAYGEYGGRLYVTTLNLLSLEVYYRHLPIYEATAK
ncbi:MAG: hypothetical protein KGQ60_15350, partial [Planctomycetes bacterium]|nr:hypothetical protein [Planctomycetota bacterium]